MTQTFMHRPVMLDEVVDALAPVPPGVLVDATLGGGGHSRALLAAAPGLRLIGIDRDPAAVIAAGANLADVRDRVQLHHASFAQLREIVGVAPVTAVLFDLGVSSPQFDIPERGFSYRQRGPLDMRMDPSGGMSADDVVNRYAEAELRRLFVASGEARFAARIARAIVAARPVRDTVELAEIVRDAIPAPARRRGGHPARRVFQAIRIEVNDELTMVRAGLDAALGLLGPGGRCAVLAYHSGEDRLVKARFAEAARGGCVCPPGMPCVCGAVAEFRLVRRGARKPSAEEVASNPRAESARLRVLERLPITPPVTPKGEP